MQFKSLAVGAIGVALLISGTATSGVARPRVQPTTTSTTTSATSPTTTTTSTTTTAPAVSCDRPVFQVNQLTYAPASPFRVGLGNTKAVVTPSTSANCEIKRWSYVLYGDNGAVAQLKNLTADFGFITVRESKLVNRDSGPQAAKVTVTYGPASGYAGTTKFNQSYQVGASLFRRGTFGSTFKAPSKVAVGGQATITAKLSRANWNTDKYGKYAGQSVVLQTRTSYGEPWGKLITRKTNASGVVTFKTTVEEDTLVRVFYFGNSTTSHAVSSEILISAI